MNGTVGTFVPPVVGEAGPRPDEDLCRRLRQLTGLTSAVSDALDALGYATSIPASTLPPLIPGRRLVGRTITLRYLPERLRHGVPGRLAHAFVFSIAAPGDVLVVEGDVEGRASAFGGTAAAGAVQARLAGVIVAGAVRDVDEIRATGLPVWARGVTPITGQGRIEAVAINMPVAVGGVQVRPGDVAVADESGVCFIPWERFTEVSGSLLGLDARGG